MELTTEQIRGIWNPIESGISVSLLQKWVVCKRRCYMHYVDRIREKPNFQADIPKLYGRIFQSCIDDDPSQLQSIRAIYGIENADPLVETIRKQSEIYKEFWKEEDTRFGKGQREEKLDTLYKLPNGKSVRLIGYIDRFHNNVNGHQYIIDTKARGKEQEHLLDGLHLDIQMMFYSLLTPHSPHKTIIHDVVHRIGAIPSSPRKRKAESIEELKQRQLQHCIDNPEKYFARFRKQVFLEDFYNFKTYVFNPLLTDFVHWYENLGTENSTNWMKPYGIYDPLFSGRQGTYHNFICTGSTKGLEKI